MIHIVRMDDRSHEREGSQPAIPLPNAQPPNRPPPQEIGGPKGPEPTRYGDWEVNGRCTDF
jgi:hypothetical protein